MNQKQSHRNSFPKGNRSKLNKLQFTHNTFRSVVDQFHRMVQNELYMEELYVLNFANIQIALTQN